MSKSLRALLAESGAFQGYTYAYPHKTAYRKLNPPRHLAELWSKEDKNALFLYAHVPFCEMRCGFCNLFTLTHPGKSLVTALLDALLRQSEAVASALGSSARFSRLALGGGTPTFLSVHELGRLFGILSQTFPTSSLAIPKAIEASPSTVDDEKIGFLKSQGITRVSLGVQSMIDDEVRSLGRAQSRQDVRRTLGSLMTADFRCVNVDLIFGIEGQTPQSWRRSLEEVSGFEPQEVYLYPLYVRPLTQLDQSRSRPTDRRIELYRLGRDYLLKQGYRQISMRLFRKQCYAAPEGPVYCCQEDGMVGLGPGARSYTTALHYSTEYAIGRSGVLSVIESFVKGTREQFLFADYGCELDQNEQKRRYVLKSLLRNDGLELSEYSAFFQSNVFSDLPQLTKLTEEGLAVNRQGWMQLTTEGLELSDAIGPWLSSPMMRERMNGFELR